MTKTTDTADPASWDPALDAVAAAPKHHRVLFENDKLRVLEVTLESDDEEPGDDVPFDDPPSPEPAPEEPSSPADPRRLLP